MLIIISCRLSKWNFSRSYLFFWKKEFCAIRTSFCLPPLVIFFSGQMLFFLHSSCSFFNPLPLPPITISLSLLIPIQEREFMAPSCFPLPLYNFIFFLFFFLSATKTRLFLRSHFFCAFNFSQSFDAPFLWLLHCGSTTETWKLESLRGEERK